MKTPDAYSRVLNALVTEADHRRRTICPLGTARLSICASTAEAFDHAVA